MSQNRPKVSIAIKGPSRGEPQRNEERSEKINLLLSTVFIDPLDAKAYYQFLSDKAEEYPNYETAHFHDWSEVQTIVKIEGREPAGFPRSEIEYYTCSFETKEDADAWEKYTGIWVKDSSLPPTQRVLKRTWDLDTFAALLGRKPEDIRT